jgi:hypothetical protein
MDSTKQVIRDTPYSHSKTTPKILPTLPSSVSSPKLVVRILKTKKKLPIANHAKIMLTVLKMNSMKKANLRKKEWSERKNWWKCTMA